MKTFKMTNGGGQALLRNKQGVKRALLYILTPLFCAGLCLGTVFSFFKTDSKVSANAAGGFKGAAYIDLTDDGSVMAAALQGGQKSAVIIGAAGTAESKPVSWDVLAVNDSTYTSSATTANKLLLFSQRVLSIDQYNYYYSNMNPENHTYWGSSYVRAKLNGGVYISGNTTAGQTPQLGTINNTASLLYNVFTGLNTEGLILPTGNIITHDVKYVNAASPLFRTVQTTATGAFSSTSTVNGQYNSTLGNQFSTMVPNFSVNFTNGVTETTTGDKLFLLAYEDINNADYGFKDSNGKTYTGSYGINWGGWQDGYYSCNDPASSPSAHQLYSGNGFIPKTYSGGVQANSYWLRSTVRDGYSSGSYQPNNVAYALAVGVLSNGGSVGYLPQSSTVVTNIFGGSIGFRPAMVVDASKIVYIVSGNAPMNNDFTDFENYPYSAGEKITYKTYIKSSDYETKSANAKAIGIPDGNSLKLIYNNTVGNNDAKMICTLSDNNGKVYYSSTFNVDVTATATKNATQTLALPTFPSGKTIADYNVSLIQSTDNGTDYTEHALCSYEIGIDAPKDTEVTYSGNSKWIADLTGDEKKEWINTDVYCNSSIMSVAKIEYKSRAEGATFVDVTSAGTANIKNAGTYKITMHLAGGYKWIGGSTDDKSFNITVKPQVIDPFAPTVDYGTNADNSTKQYYAGTTTANFPTIKPPALWDGKGSLVWDSGQNLTTTKPYNWTFTPDDLNYDVKKGTLSITVTPVAVNKIEATLTGTGDIFTSTKKEDLLKRIQVTKTNNDGTAAGIAATSEIQFATGTTLTAGTNKVLTVQLVGNTSVSCTVTIPEILAVTPAELSVVHDGTTVYTSTSADALKGQLTVKIINNDGSAGKTLEASEYSFPDDFALEDGDCPVQVTYKYTVDGEEKTLTGDITISVGIAGVKSVSLAVDESKLNGVTLWEGAAANTIKQYLIVTIKFDDGNDTTATLDASKYTVNITGSEKNVLIAGQCNFTVSYGGKTSNTKNVPVSAVLVDTLTANYSQNGRTIYSSATVEDLQIDTLLSVEAVYNNGDPDTLDKDSYTVTIPDNFSSTNNLVTVTWKKGDVTKTTTFPVTVTDVAVSGITAEYTLPEGFTLDASKGLEDLNGGLKVVLKYNNNDTKTLSSEGYTLTADSTHGDGLLSAGARTITVTYSDGKTATFTVNVAKADVDASGATLKPSAISGLTADDNGGYKATYKPDSDGFKFTVADLDPDSIPAAATPKAPVYKKLVNGNWETVSEIKEAGEYKVVVEFDPTDPANYNGGIDPVEIAITIDDAVVTGVTAKVEGDAAFNTASTLDDVKAKLAAEIEYNNGNKESVKVEDLEITCEGLHDGKLKAGKQVVTVKYSDGVETTVEIEVAKVKVALPVFNGGLKYTGVAIKPTVDNFNGFDSALMTFVTDKLQSGTVVGTYKAVFALTDPENYEWATAKTYKKSVFAAVVYDEEVTLLANEAAVDWNISKAVLTATKKEGALPVFASESYIGELGEVVGLRYYTDETCTEEVAADQLAKETTYYVKAELLDTDNFELDASAAAYTVKSFTYTTPAKELTTWDKVVRFLKANWLWLVIAVVALILLIIIIACAVRASKKKREREEQRRLEEKAERERREEREEQRRREEREERMARLSQQQQMPPMMMPQMMPQMMGGQMPQSMPQAQAAQAMPAGGGASSSEIAELKAEILALKTAQESAKEIAELKAENAAMKAEQNAVLRSDVNALRGGEQVIQGGISLDKLTEIIRTEVNAALDSRVKAAAQPATADSGAAPAAAQVPPDAVMTTVTTTKIDTTKKPAQNAQAAAPVRTVVRNVVAPMPVDDGRVFDVGGFYKPADPVNDMGFTDEDKSE
ncbi:MAG: hypothetical protein K2I17_00280 [Clostridia bacterium]|nr:hypothetical protein [Clostridia bacterium]